MTRLIRAILFRISYRRYARFGANRMLTGKELRPQTYRPKHFKKIHGTAGQGDVWHGPASRG